MAFGIIDTSILTAIANAIRTKLGVQTTYRPSEMAAAIASITSGGITPTGTKSISANGTGIDVAQYAYVDVAVPTSGASIEGVTEVTISTPASNVTELDAAFSGFVNSGETCFFVRKDAMTGTNDTILVPYISGEINSTILRRNINSWSTLSTTNSAYAINMNTGDKFIKITLDTGGAA